MSKRNVQRLSQILIKINRNQFKIAIANAIERHTMNKSQEKCAAKEEEEIIKTENTRVKMRMQRDAHVNQISSHRKMCVIFGLWIFVEFKSWYHRFTASMKLSHYISHYVSV